VQAQSLRAGTADLFGEEERAIARRLVGMWMVVKKQ